MRSTGTLVVVLLAVGLVCALAYLVMGRLPVTVTGNAVVVSRYSVQALESNTHGRIESWQVQPGVRSGATRFWLMLNSLCWRRRSSLCGKSLMN
ncbi:MAG: hypothetical protein CM1200mP20_13660 [Pseudomonadota bacterium]|nr:MAG: hypothetical protein CM1200mP20_13660 [Pseudomonadota bacterium]